MSDRDLRRAAEAALDPLVSPEGWVHASATPVSPEDPGRYHALFGRDALITALQLLRSRPRIAAATLRALAVRQGRVEDPATEEQPGRILHEDRPIAPAELVARGWPVRDGALRYYGSSDSTSWWLVVLAATGDESLWTELAGAREGAAAWLERALATGSGLVRSGPREGPGGLGQQGWRDAADPAEDPHGGGIVHADGTTPSPPLADADSQAVAVAALDALAVLEPARAEHWARQADLLRARVQAAFTPEVLAVDGDGAPVAGPGSQLGWLLWAGALDGEAAERAADRLVRPDLLTAYGVRTLASTSPAFLVEGYHRGAVWPFDCWVCWGGLRAVGRHEEAERLRDGVRRALRQLGDQPELYAVTPAGELRAVAIANRVQAWTLGALIAFDDDWDGRAR